MALLDLALAKRHLRVWHDDDDAEIAVYLAAAENIVVEYIDREVVAAGATPTTLDGVALSPAITAAILLLTGDLYENREADPEASGNVVLPKSVRALLAPWRVWRPSVVPIDAAP